VCVIATMLVGSSALVVSIGGAAATVPAATAPASWHLPFPQTMSYWVLGWDRYIKCGPPDATFSQEVASEGLEKYAIDLVAGHRGECSRLKGEQFKRLYPDKMLIQYQSPAAEDPRTWPGGSWAGYYLMMNRTSATGAVSAGQTSITVANPRVFSVGDTAVIWLPTASDPYANSEWVSVKAISGSTLTVARNMFSTGAHVYATAPLIAAAATGPGYPNPDVNLSSVAPANPANHLRANQWMAHNVISDFAPSTAGAPTFDAVEFDAASWTPPAQNTNGALKNVDCNGDGTIDYCNQNVGTSRQVSAYGVGVDAFLQAVKQGLTVYDTDPTRPPKMVLADGEMGLRSLDSADGVELEDFPSWNNYTYSSSALDTLGVWQSQDSAPGPHLSYEFTKDPTPLYPQNGCVTPANGGTCRNGEYRYGMASALLLGGADAYNKLSLGGRNEGSFTYPQPWDEEATIDQSTTGLTSGYLGQPLGRAVRTTRYTSGNLTTNPSFEQDLTSVTNSSFINGAMTVSRDTSTAAPGSGTSSLRADVTAQTADPNRSDARVFSALTGSLSPGEYTVDFWAKGISNTAGPPALPLGVSLDGISAAPDVILITNTWTHYYLQLDVNTAVAKNADAKFSLGSQIGAYWLDGINVHRGTAGILTREFTNGIVVLNDSFSTQTAVPLSGGTYHHINGVQDRSVNDGTSVGSVLPSIAAKDGVILLRDP
jgi:hypothetical protein